MKKFVWMGTAVLVSACASTAPAPTPEQIEMQRKLVDAFTQRLAAQPAPVPQQVAAATPASPTLTETELQAQIDKLPSSDASVWVRFEPAPDGFKYNGQLFLAPEGRVTGYAGDEQSGVIVYTVRSAPQQVAVRMAKPAAGPGSVLLGTAYGQPGDWRFVSVTGTTIGGDALVPTPSGLVIARDRSGFSYKAGQGPQSFGVPEGFHVAPFQRGDIGTTSNILIERDEVQQDELTKNAAALAHTFGISKKYDYALLDIGTGKVTEIPIALSDKETVFLGNCHKRNKLINECDNEQSLQSIWSQNGTRNGKHPFWRLTWLSTKTAPILISKEGTLGSTVVVTNLKTGQRYTAFERTLGVNDFDPVRNPDGSVTLKARLGFSDDAIRDLDAFMASGIR